MRWPWSWPKLFSCTKSFIIIIIKWKVMRKEVDQILDDRKNYEDWPRLNKINLTAFFKETNMPYLIFECRLQVLLQILIKFTSHEILEIRLPRSLESSVDAYGYENLDFIFKLNLKIRKTMVELYRCLSWARCSPSKSAQETKRRFPQSCGRIIFTNTDSQSSKFYSLIPLHNFITRRLRCFFLFIFCFYFNFV